MKIECLSNAGNSLPIEIREIWHISENRILPIHIGEVYNVYGICFIKKDPWFLIFEYDEQPHPIYYPYHLFKIIDGRIPNNWFFGQEKSGKDFVFGMKEMIDEAFFYGELLEGSSDNNEKFLKYKNEVDNQTN